MRWWIAMVCLLITTPSGAAEFRLTSPVVKEQGTVANEQVFNSFGCSGKNISPELHWDNGPSETKSFALTVYDPDAPTGSGWWHWVVFNIPVSVHMLPANAGKPDNVIAEGAIQSMTDFGQPGYGGPCPPSGDRPGSSTPGPRSRGSARCRCGSWTQARPRSWRAAPERPSRPATPVPTPCPSTTIRAAAP